MKKHLINFFSIFLTWNLIAIPVGIVLVLLNIKIENDYRLYALFEMGITFTIFLISVLIFRKDLVSDVKRFFKDKDILGNVIAITILAFLCEIVGGIFVRSLILILGLPLVSSENNEMTMNLLKSAPVLMGIGAVVLGPIYEELIMRLGFAKTFKNKKVFFAASGIIFGIMHVVDSKFVIITLPIIFILIDRIVSSDRKSKFLLSTTMVILYFFLTLSVLTFARHGISGLLSTIKLTELLYSIQYIAMGLYLAYVYLKKKNIWYTIIPHMLINAIGVFGLLLT